MNPKLTRRPARRAPSIRGRLISAGAMLLVSAILMVSTSYAWFVLSTAPEVANIKTQVGANGALEIALLDKESWSDLTRLDMADIDESDTESVTSANLTWGNLVNLGDSSYGMDNIILNPARLNIAKSGTDEAGAQQYTVNTVLLKTPVYGEDGRVEGLEEQKAVAYTYGGSAFDVENGYGVRAIGTSSTMGVFQLGMNAARSAIITYTSAARTKASNALSENGSALANIVVKYAVDGLTTGYTAGDIKAIKTMAEGLKDALDEIGSALRQTFAGYITTDGSGVTGDTYQAALDGINNEDTTLKELLQKYPGIASLIPDMAGYIDKLDAHKTDVQKAIKSCEEKIGTGRTNDFNWSEISAIIYPLVDTDKLTVGGKNIDELKNSVKNEDGSINMGEAYELIKGGILITVPSGSGILSDISDFAGDYTAKVSATITYNGSPMTGEATMTTKTTVSPVYLTACGNGLKAGTIAEAEASNAITDYYGYAIDLAFRTNATESDLLLQTEPQNRIWEDDSTNAALQGGGSYMSFTTSAGISATKMVRLMSGIRVVFMDKAQTVLAIAALDCTLGKDVYVLLPESERTEAKYAYLDIGGTYQNSDVISKAEYEKLGANSSVTIDKTARKITAKLYLYDFKMTESATSTEDETKYTGGITLSKKADGSAVITALEQDEAKIVTALVYLDGSVVNNSSVAANSLYSMTGTLNLQFASSATLMPAENNALRGDDSVVYTELDSTTYQAGYYYDGTDLYKIRENVKLYQGSDGKLYSGTVSDGTTTYAELTELTAVMDQVTATLTGGESAKTGTAFQLTAALDQGGVEVTEYTLKREETTAETNTTGTFSVTEGTTGEVKYQAVLTVQVGTGDDNTQKETYTITTKVLTVTVGQAT